MTSAHLDQHFIFIPPFEARKYINVAHLLFRSTPNKFGWLPIHKAAVVKESHLLTHPNIRGVERIIDCFPEGLLSSTLDGQLPIHLSLMSNSFTPIEIIQLLVDKCPESVHWKDKYGQLPLHKAASNRRISPDVIDLLISTYPGGACVKDNFG